MLLTMFIVVATALTCAMFATKQMMLGYPCVIFWALTAGQAYILHTTTWDIYYILAFASGLGMVVFSALGMYGLRDKKKSLGEEEESNKYIDEGSKTGLEIKDVEKVGEEKAGGSDLFNMDSEHTPSEREKNLNKRVKNRREGKSNSLNINR